MLKLQGTPYLLDAMSEKEILRKIKELEDRVRLLRERGTLTEQTIRHYYGQKRFEQVAESNAIEGSTLSAGETELAVLKGITITGHDPAYIRDAKALDAALQRLAVMAKENKQPTDIEQLHELHGLILGGRPGGGMFRREPVTIKGSDHTPPRTWREVMDQMEAWEKWSKNHYALPAPVRAIILHAWMAHIHPFIDGNGRSARAITNLELIRAGYPPIIIKKKERDRYIQSLSESDSAGDIRSFFELMIERIEGALTGLEISASQKEGYNALQQKIRRTQEQQLKIWETSIQLLVSTLEHFIHEAIGTIGGSVSIKTFESPLDLDDYISLCEGKAAPKSWAFITTIKVPGLRNQVRLAYVGFRSQAMQVKLGNEGGPSLYWSKENPDGYPKWISAENSAPFAGEITTKLGVGDEWYARKTDGSIMKINTTGLAKSIATSLVDMAADNQ
ncbi:Fic family protein [Geomonas azotofigens]|uniref:Fic family protein n=1 Tax=Geomonas azotofigens TaxID=2843196 RepID=UPI001C0F7165|nr:Fic family protein [Geomonas azotofigens]MBU5612178.1 Fic family protein [Geomonas azotofigens]